MNDQVLVAPDSLPGQLARIVADCFRSVLSQLAGFPISVEVGAAGLAPGQAPPDEQSVWVILSASKALNGEMAIVTPAAGALQLAQVLMSEPLDSAAPFDQNRRDGYEELLRQVFGQVPTGLKSAGRGEVEIKLAGSDPPVWSGATQVEIRITGEKLAPVRLVLMLTRELAASQPPPLPGDARLPGSVNQAPASGRDAQAAKNPNLELVLDVTLDATIRFGQKQMLLREILELHPGIAIALDQRIEEPVELLIGGRMIARGEVVIVDGNYGIRVTELVSPSQRIESLRSSS